MPKTRLLIAVIGSQVVLLALLAKHQGTPRWPLVLAGIAIVVATILIMIGRQSERARR